MQVLAPELPPLEGDDRYLAVTLPLRCRYVAVSLQVLAPELPPLEGDDDGANGIPPLLLGDKTELPRLPSLETNGRSSKYETADFGTIREFFRRQVATVEVRWQGVPQLIVFQLPPSSHYLHASFATELQRSLDRSSREIRLADLVLRVDVAAAQIAQQEWLATQPLHYRHITVTIPLC